MTILQERGYFWWDDEPAPDSALVPASAVPGLLKIDDDGRAQLDLDGFLPNDKGPFAIMTNQTVPGMSVCGLLKTPKKSVLLSDLYRTGAELHSNGISFERFTAACCLVGDMPFSKRASALRFSSFDIELKGFEAWLRFGSIDVARTKRTIRARYKTKPHSVYTLDDGSIVLRPTINWPPLGKHRTGSISLAESAWLTYRLRRRGTLADIKHLYGMLADLFVVLTESDYRLDWPLVSGGKNREQYKYYFPLQASTAPAPALHECCTNFAQVRECFGDILSSWKKKRELYGPGFYMYLAARRGLRPYVESRFIAQVSGVESFHRSKYPQSAQVEKFSQKVQRILEQVADGRDRKWLEGRLSHAGEPSLADRIFSVFSVLPLGLESPALRRFAEGCAQMRHNLSHFGGQREPANYAALIQDVYLKGEALGYLYHALLLHEVGVQAELLNRWFYDSAASFRIKWTFVSVGLLDNSILNLPNVVREGERP